MSGFARAKRSNAATGIARSPSWCPGAGAHLEDAPLVSLGRGNFFKGLTATTCNADFDLPILDFITR